MESISESQVQTQTEVTLPKKVISLDKFKLIQQKLQLEEEKHIELLPTDNTVLLIILSDVSNENLISIKNILSQRINYLNIWVSDSKDHLYVEYRTEQNLKDTIIELEEFTKSSFSNIEKYFIKPREEMSICLKMNTSNYQIEKDKQLTLSLLKQKRFKTDSGNVKYKKTLTQPSLFYLPNK